MLELCITWIGVRIMNKRIALAVILLFSMFFSCLISGCNKQSNITPNEIKYVSEDTVWFDYSKKDLDILNGSCVCSYMDTNLVRVNDGYASYSNIFRSHSSNDMESNFILLSNDGDVIVNRAITPEELGIDSHYTTTITNVTSKNGDPIIFIDADCFDTSITDLDSLKLIYNYNTQEIEDMDYLVSSAQRYGYIDTFGFTENGYDYIVAHNMDTESITVLLGMNGEVVNTYNVNENNSITALDRPYVANNEIVFPAYSTGEENNPLFIIGLDDYSTRIEEGSEYVTAISTYTNQSGNTYAVCIDGIYKDDNCIMPADSSYCNPSCFYSSVSRIIDADDEHFVLLSSRSRIFGVNEYYLSFFTKADSNPNVGKSIITLGYFGLLDDSISEGVSEFNATNTDYFVVLKSYGSEVSINDSSSFSYRNYVTGELSNQLAIDLMSGDGPDIIVNGYPFYQFNNPEYLLDLSDFIDNDLSGEHLFENVINASRSSGHVYQLPTSFYIVGIIAESENIQNQSGFTFANYINYVDTVCNGNNPLSIENDRITVLSDFLASNPSAYLDKHGNINFDTAMFTDIAEYCCDNIAENPTNVYNSSNGNPYMNNYSALQTFEHYMQMKRGYFDFGIYGLPSNNVSGPSISANGSIGIAACAGDIDGAKSFVKFILTTPEIYQNSNSIVLSEDITRSVATTYLNWNNEMYSTADDIERNMSIFEYDESLIDDYVNLIKTADSVLSIDPNILVIVREEMPAYFAGQKSLHDVILIINNRAQTVVDEYN